MMNTLKTFARKTTGLVLALTVLMFSVSLLGGAAPVMAATSASPTAALPASAACTLTVTTRTCDLYAKPGTLALPSGSVTIWGYSDTDLGAAQLPGPVIVANVGETLQVTLHNGLAEATSLNFPLNDIAPDTAGAAPGGTKTYSFTLSTPGTFIYEAGLTPDMDAQVAMGLFGAMIVRPAVVTQAYDDVSTTFDDEALLVLSEVDPALNADPANFDMRNFKPKYWLINGLAYPDTLTISSGEGHRVLLRYVNAGLTEHNMNMLGAEQTIVGMSGEPEVFNYTLNDEWIGTGMTMDSIVNVPMGSVLGTKLPLYDRGLHLDNNAAVTTPGGPVALGGMLTYITVDSSTAATPLLVPITSGVGINPSPAAATGNATLTATITDPAGTGLTGAEYYLDSLSGPATPISVGLGTSPLSVNISIPLTGLTGGDHAIYVRGQNPNGWGPVSSTVLSIVAQGPVISGDSLNPDTSNGSVSVALSATANDVPANKSFVTNAEYFIDVTGANGTGTALTTNGPAFVVAVSGNLPQAVVNGLPEGPHQVFVHAQDALGNWGDFATLLINVDKTGPTANTVVVSPNPNNGQIPLNATIAAVQVSANLVDPLISNVNSPVAAGEVFIDVVGANGTGIPMTAVDGLWSTTTEPAYANIPLPTIAQLSTGVHTFYVHAKDSAGNWGSTSAATLVVDKLGPALTSLTAAPNPARFGNTVTLHATATDPLNGAAPASNVAAAEYWLNSPRFGAPRPFTGTFTSSSVNLTATVQVRLADGWFLGSNRVYMHARDALGNWGPIQSMVVTVNLFGPAILTSSNFDTGFGNFAPSGSVTLTPAANLNAGGSNGLQVDLNGSNPAFVQDTNLLAEFSYQASFLFHPNGAETGSQMTDIFVGSDTSGHTLFGIQYEKVGPSMEVSAWVRKSDGTIVSSGSHHVQNGANQITLFWTADVSGYGYLSLVLDGKSVETLKNIDTSAYNLDIVQLGAVSSLAPGASGTMYFDNFSSSRSAALFNTLYLPALTR